MVVSQVDSSNLATVAEASAAAPAIQNSLVVKPKGPKRFIRQQVSYITSESDARLCRVLTAGAV